MFPMTCLPAKQNGVEHVSIDVIKDLGRREYIRSGEEGIYKIWAGRREYIRSGEEGIYKIWGGGNI